MIEPSSVPPEAQSAAGWPPLSVPPLALPPDVPIALLPVRLETRSLNNELLIRIYPDILHVDAHEEALTSFEIEHGVQYWSAVAAAGDDPVWLHGAWNALTSEYGVERAAWIARRTRDGRPGDTPASDQWGRAPVARLLPTRWRAAGYGYSYWASGSVYLAWDVAGAPITGEREVGPDPGAGDPGDVPDEQAVVTPGMRWMVDFAEAERVGMGIRITTAHTPYPAQPLARVIVYGVDESGGTAPALADLLEGHHYTGGFGFVDPGTPTNNTDLGRSGYAPEAAESSERHRIADGTRTPPPATPAPDGVASRLATALGLGEPVARVLGRDRAGDRIDRQGDMNAMVWASSWGYFLLQVLEGVPLAAVREARRHFIDHVRAGGSLPVLRIGDQPYGVLPVVSLKHWANREGGSVHPQLVGLLKRALPAWTQAAWNATVAPRSPWARPGQARDRYFELLATQATAVGHAGRSALGPEYIGNLWRFAQLDFDARWRVAPRAAANRLFTELGLPTDQRHTGTVFAEEAFDVAGPTVGPDPAAYLEQLGDLSPLQLAAAAEHGQTPLLYRLARHSALQEWWSAVLMLRGGDRRYVEEELVDIDPGAPPAVTLWRALGEPGPGGQTVEAYLQGAGPDDPVAADLHEFRARLAALAAARADGAISDEALDRTLRGALDLAAHRLDAWITSYANRRLDFLRAPDRRPNGLIAGGYGWVVNPAPATLTAAPDPPPDEPAPVYTDTGNAGHVLAPSLQHAVTAAVLHAGYVARGGRAGKPGAVAVNLDADRVRLVRHLIEGAQAGQPLGALLGYRFERALAEGGASGVPALILPFRLLAPFTAQQLGADGAASEVTSVGAVADGVELVRRWHAGEISWGTAPDPAGHPEATLPATGTPEHAAAEGALALAADGLDALADAALAEGVHHLAGGNQARAGAALDALAKGEAPAPDLDVVRTPRTGSVHAHRLMFLGSVDVNADFAIWPTDGRQIRAGIEPTLNGWAGRMLGDPSRVRCRGVWYSPAGAELATGEVTLADLRLSPLDVVALARTDDPSGDFELRQRFIDRLRHLRPPSVPDEIMAVPDFGRHPSWPQETLSVGELLQMARAVRDALLGGRTVREEDLAGPGERRALQWNLSDMTNRVAAARIALTRSRDELVAAVAAGDIGGMGGQLTSLSYMGVAGAFPEIGRGWSDALREELRVKSRAVLVEVERRLAAEDALRAAFDDSKATDPARVSHHTERLRALLGDDFPVAPTFRVADPAALAALFSHSDALLAGDPLAPGTWLDRLARVRAGAGRLQRVLAFAEATGAPGATDLTVAQLPYAPGDLWAGLAEGGRAEPRTALAVHGIRPLQPTSSLAGLLFDEWTEMVPGDHEVAGLSFHYDAPSSRAPQAVLLAVPPGADGTWSVENLRDTVLEALDLARARAVDLPTLDQYGHLLPALYFGLNETGATASTDFTGAAATPPVAATGDKEATDGH